MGLFDKLKTFAGMHGCSVEMTSLEKQNISDVSFPLTDSVFKGNYNVNAKSDCTILAHIHEVVVEVKKDDIIETTVIASDKHDEKTEIIGTDLKWPYDLGAGQSKSDGFCITDVDIPAVLKKLGFSNPQAAINSKEVNFFVKVTADVKGTPLDSECKVPFRVVNIL